MDKFRQKQGIMGNQKGFTLIELIIVIVILGILSAVAIPKYQDIRGEAAQAACEGVYGAAQGATSINFATRLVSPSMATVITTAASLTAAMEGGTPTGWSTTGATLSTTIGTTNCYITVNTIEDNTRKAILGKNGF